MRLPLATLIVLALSAGAGAAPWQTDSYTINPGTFHSATQFDEAGDYALVIQCHEESGVFELYVESPFDWEEGASYAPEVPAVLTIDGIEVTDVMFYFDDKQIVEGIRADNSTQAFPALLERLLVANQPIGLTYFDRSTSFSAEGIEDALYTLAGSCS